MQTSHLVPCPVREIKPYFAALHYCHTRYDTGGRLLEEFEYNGKSYANCPAYDITDHVYLGSREVARVTRQAQSFGACQSYSYVDEDILYLHQDNRGAIVAVESRAQSAKNQPLTDPNAGGQLCSQFSGLVWEAEISPFGQVINLGIRGPDGKIGTLDDCPAGITLASGVGGTLPDGQLGRFTGLPSEMDPTAGRSNMASTNVWNADGNSAYTGSGGTGAAGEAGIGVQHVPATQVPSLLDWIRSARQEMTTRNATSWARYLAAQYAILQGSGWLLARPAAKNLTQAVAERLWFRFGSGLEILGARQFLAEGVGAAIIATKVAGGVLSVGLAVLTFSETTSTNDMLPLPSYQARGYGQSIGSFGTDGGYRYSGDPMPPGDLPIMVDLGTAFASQPAGGPGPSRGIPDQGTWDWDAGMFGPSDPYGLGNVVYIPPNGSQ